MTKENPAPQARQLVIFHLFPGLSYKVRLGIAFSVIFAGLALQVIALHWLPGIVLIFGGNLLLMIKGCSNKFEPGKFNPAANWQKADASRLFEIEERTKKIKKWDRSFLDISNGRGAVVFAFFFVLALLFNTGCFGESMIYKIAGYDILALVLPQLLTGRRSIFLLPNLIIKIRVITKLLTDDAMVELLTGHDVEYYVLLQGNDAGKLPSDVKFRVKIAGQHPDFLGYYGQVVINTVSQAYPYFYVVLVAKSGYGLKKATAAYQAPKNIITEFSENNGVEVLVIRQRTTTTSGYFTDPKTIKRIFSEGLELAKKAAVK